MNLPLLYLESCVLRDNFLYCASVKDLSMRLTFLNLESGYLSTTLTLLNWNSSLVIAIMIFFMSCLCENECEILI